MRIISLNYTLCVLHFTKDVSPTFTLLVAPTIYGLPSPFLQTYHLGETLYVGENPTQQQKMFISNTKKILLTK